MSIPFKITYTFSRSDGRLGPLTYSLSPIIMVSWEHYSITKFRIYLPEALYAYIVTCFSKDFETNYHPSTIPLTLFQNEERHRITRGRGFQFWEKNPKFNYHTISLIHSAALNLVKRRCSHAPDTTIRFGAWEERRVTWA